MRQRIVIIDDEPLVLSFLDRALTREGFAVQVASNGKAGKALVASEKPDLVLLDLQLPDTPGQDICKLIRTQPQVRGIPILVVTGRTDPGQAAECLNSGADDFLQKPFDSDELVARVRALLRRPALYAGDQGVIRYGPLTIDLGKHEVVIGSRHITNLTPKEFALLRHIITFAPRVVDKNTLALKTWGVPFDQLHQRTMDVHMRRIRNKLGPKTSLCLKTIPSIGYQWRADTPEKTVPAAKHP